MTEDPRLAAVIAELRSVCSDGNADVRRVALAVLAAADKADPIRLMSPLLHRLRVQQELRERKP